MPVKIFCTVAAVLLFTVVCQCVCLIFVVDSALQTFSLKITILEMIPA